MVSKRAIKMTKFSAGRRWRKHIMLRHWICQMKWGKNLTTRQRTKSKSPAPNPALFSSYWITLLILDFFSISLPQTVPLPITDLLNTYLGNTVFVYWHKFVCVITQTPFFCIRTQTLLVQHSGMLLLQYNAENVKVCGAWGGGDPLFCMQQGLSG